MRGAEEGTDIHNGNADMINMGSDEERVEEKWINLRWNCCWIIAGRFFYTNSKNDETFKNIFFNAR